jgi:hypothetical protein
MVAGNLNKYRRFAKSLMSFAKGYFIPCETGSSLGTVARGLPRYYERGNFRYFWRINIKKKSPSDHFYYVEFFSYLATVYHNYSN